MNTVELIKKVEVAQPFTPLGLGELAAAINREHQECRENYVQSLVKARNCGEYLELAYEEVRRIYGWGHWEKWLQENCVISLKTVRRYRQIARDWAKLEESVSVTDLTFTDALLLLSESQEDEESPQVELKIEPKQEVKAIAPATIGQTAKVTNPENVFSGQKVEVVGQTGGFLLGRTSKGVEYPFLPDELDALDVVAIAPSPTKSRYSSAQLLDLLSRVYEAVGGSLTPELQAEVESVLSS